MESRARVHIHIHTFYLPLFLQRYGTHHTLSERTAVSVAVALPSTYTSDEREEERSGGSQLDLEIRT